METSAFVQCLFNSPEVLSPAIDKVKCFVKLFSENSNLDECTGELHSFSSNPNLVVDNILISSKMVKKFISSLDYSKTSVAFLSSCSTITILIFKAGIHIDILIFS